MIKRVRRRPLKQKEDYELGFMLFMIHSHGGLCTPDEIVYTEKKVIELLKQLGYPKAIFKGKKYFKMFEEDKDKSETFFKVTKSGTQFRITRKK